MEVWIRIVITVLFISIVAIAIVFLGIFGIIPAKRLTTVLQVEERKLVREEVVTGEREETGEPAEPQPVVPSASPVTSEGQVVTPEKKPVRLDVEPGSPEAPQQSNPISEEDIPQEAVKLKISASGILPDSFTVQSGSVVTLSVSSVDTQTHIFKFKDPNLKAVAVGVGPGETRAITFNAPQAGSYDFFCDVPGHEGRGERGMMVVK